MTDRISFLTVVLSEDMRTDDVDALIDVIKQFRYVADVIPGAPVSPEEYVMRARLITEMIKKLTGGD